MGREWNERAFAENWIEAQSGEGDEWRLRLINPIVRRLCSAVTDGHDPFSFSVYQPLVETKKENAGARAEARWAGVTVVDLGCGKGCLGTVVKAGGAAYRGVDLSPDLVDHARTQRGLTEVTLADLDALPDAQTLRHMLGELGPKAIITCVLVLEHLREPANLLAHLATCLGESDHEIPVMVVTLARSCGAGGDAPGEESPEVDIPIRSMKQEPSPTVRARPVYQRRWAVRFRDAGFHVRSCEPLCFSPTERIGDPAHPYAFWCWRLVARRRLHVGDDWIPEAEQVLKSLPDRLRTVEWMRIYDVPKDARFIHAFNIGGELTVLLRGTAHLRLGDAQPAAKDLVVDEAALEPTHGSLLFRPGHVFGELEAAGRGGPAYFSHDVIAGASGCRVAVLSSEVVRTHLQPDTTALDGFFFEKLRNRFQLDALRDGIARTGTGNRLGGVASRDLRRLARILLWTSAIERRHRCRGDSDTAVWLNLMSVGEIFQPDRQDVDGLSDALRLFHRMRIVDVLPLGTWHRLDTEMQPMIDQVGRELVATACHTHLGPTVGRGMSERQVATAIGELQQMGRKMFVSSRVVNGVTKWTIKPRVRKWLDQLKKMGLTEKAVARLEAFLGRLSFCWHDQGSNVFIVIRDRYALQRLGLGSVPDANAATEHRESYLGWSAAAPESLTEASSGSRAEIAWQPVISLLEPEKRRIYLDLLGKFCETDLSQNGSQTLRFSDELATL